MSNPNVPPALSVWQVMPRLTLSTVVLCAIALAGCQGDKKLTLDPEAPRPKNPASSGSPAEPTGESAPAAEPKSVTNPEVFKVKPGKEIGYAPSKINLQDLGKKTDDGIHNLKNGKGVVVMQFEGPKGKLNGNIDIKVRDSSTYMVEYLLPKTEVTPNRLVADGKKKMVYEDRKWVSATPRDTSKPMTTAELDEFISRYPAEVMSGLVDGAPVWSRLLTALESDQGRATTVEEQKITVNKIERPIYRIVSRRKGAQDEELEIVIDGHRWLPLTVKASFHDENKAPVRIFWTANWLFGGTFPDSDFTIPVK